MYGMASCRFLYVDFQSDRGGFGEFYMASVANGSPVMYRAGAGLFAWLSPFNSSDWSVGKCEGYTAGQIANFDDNIFEASRVFGVLSVLSGVGITAWTLFLSCLSIGRLQICFMSLVFFLLTCFVGFAFTVFQSGLCKSLVTSLNPSYKSKCTLDQGGLVAIAGSIFWCVAFLISVIYIKSPNSDFTISPDGRITNAFQERQLERDRKIREKQRLREKAAMQRREEREEKSNMRNSRSNSFGQGLEGVRESIDMMEDGTTEVQLEDHRGNAGSP